MEALMKKIVFVIIVFFALLVISDPLLAQKDTEYATSLKYYNSKKYKEAVEHLKDYVKKNPDPAAYYLMGYSLYKLKRFDEATKYFNEAYLIDPEFSLEKAGLIQKQPEGKPKEITKPSEEQVPPKPSAIESKVVKPELKKESASVKQIPSKQEPAQKQPLKETQSQKPGIPEVTPQKKAEPQKVAPQKKPGGPAELPVLPKPKKPMPGVAPALLTGLFAGFMMFFLAIWIALYVYGSLSLFLIAKKLNVPSPWTAWIPLVQVWTFVTSAGKPWWWILLLLVPIVNAVVGVYLWICITETLGRNKWLGLLMLVPVVNLVWLGILAFSKTETTEDQTKTIEIEPPAGGAPPEEQF